MNLRGITSMGVSLVLGSQTMGIIVGGPNGYGLGNATASGLQSDLDTRSLPAFLFWNNLLRVADSSGIYLGRNATTGRGWVMTAAHVTELFTGTDSITVMGQSYTVRDSRIIQHTDSTGTFNTDIRLYAIGGQSGDPALPALPAVPLLESDVVNGDDLVLTGRGRRQQTPVEDTTPPYAWDWDPNQSTRQMRWGSNHVEFWTEVAPYLLFSLTEGSPVSKKTICFASVFDDPAINGTAFEGQLAWLDSGGGAFVKRNATWYLAGTNYEVDDAVANQAGYGDVSLMPHLPSYRGQIETITGSLVPDTTGPEADFDGDGISNLLEYALNLDPAVNEQVFMQPTTGLRGLPAVYLENTAGSERLTIEFVRRTSGSGSGLTYIPEFSSDLQTWEAVGTESVSTINPRWDRVKVVDSLTTGDTQRRFARLRVELAP